MYKHTLFLLAQEVIVEPEFNDGVYKHVVYAYSTLKLDDNNNVIGKHVTRGVVYLDDPITENYIPNNQVTKQLLEQWVIAKLDITGIQNININEINK
jgi:hypothetical protein